MQSNAGPVVIRGSNSAPVLSVFIRLQSEIGLVDIDTAAQILLNDPELFQSATRFTGWRWPRFEEPEILARVDAEFARYVIENLLK